MAASTIAAIATAPGKGAVGMVRISGPNAFAVAQAVAGPLPAPRSTALRQFRDAQGAALDSGLVLVFAAPQSFTGEHVVELQGHGGPVVLAEVLAACLAAGALAAKPGEFSERAFLNNRLDLAQAEAIADLIDASSAQAVRAAQATLHGAFSAVINQLVQGVMDARVWVEGALDFSDEDVNWLADQGLLSRLRSLQSQLALTLSQASQGQRLRDGVSIAIVGAPNVGKSTLLNALAGYDAAIVSPVAGTTRDVLKEHLLLGGLPVTVVDTAGLRDTEDLIEAEGIRRAHAAAQKAELVLYLADARSGLSTADQQLRASLPTRPVITVYNKADLAPVAEGLGISAKTGLGMPALIAAIHAQVFHVEHGEGQFMARSRHIAALKIAQGHINSALAELANANLPELAAEELRLAQQALAQITGSSDSETLLGEIFSRFCIGK